MEAFIWWLLGAVILLFIADIIRAQAGSNIFSTVMWLASAAAAYKAWQLSPWKAAHPVLSFTLMFLGTAW